MAITLRWSPQASDDLERIIGYLENTWGEKSVKEFVQALDQNVSCFGYQRRGKALCNYKTQHALLQNSEWGNTN